MHSKVLHSGDLIPYSQKIKLKLIKKLSNTLAYFAPLSLKKKKVLKHWKLWPVIYDRNAIGQYYKTTIVVKASPS
jgi:hypothetical protein